MKVLQIVQSRPKLIGLVEFTILIPSGCFERGYQMLLIWLWVLPGMVAGAMLDASEGGNLGVLVGAILGPLMVFVWVCNGFNRNVR